MSTSSTSSAGLNQVSLTTIDITLRHAELPAEKSAFAVVPFNFMVGEKQLQAGLYQVQRTGRKDLLVIRHAESESDCVFVHAIPLGQSRRTSKLIFYRQKNLYYLGQVLVGVN
jgi:hypothetical protein